MGNACRSQGKVSETAPARPPPIKLQTSVETESDKSEDEEITRRAEERLRRIQTAREGALKTLRTSRALSMHHERRVLYIQGTRHKLGLEDAEDVNFGGLRGSFSDTGSEDEDKKSKSKPPPGKGADAPSPPNKTIQRHKSIFGPCGSDLTDIEDSGEAPFGSRLESGPAAAAPDVAARLAEELLAEKGAQDKQKERKSVRMSVGGEPDEDVAPKQDRARSSSPDTPRTEQKKKRAVIVDPAGLE
ncbi:hypothetical protein BESB_016660 [Besnoitia besnoiti]|uniref:Uncharacterized protein n=1 Tax=Besnoitia besnoiti TaxID=94643 RepID=A0A2A9M1I0_BESBE|nr:hypothetical protein BESB_016660 [Besnoitia besnoiti]PFH32348.1 hypothetical protein BESB_016660 [Besnoitia besnoiti]